ncbi:MAG: hypothetical protein V3S46_00195 [Nitrospinota bacterium]
MTENGRYAVLLMAVLSFGLGIFHLVSNDLWWHLRSGQWVLENMAFPSTDPFSYTAEGRRWIYHNWLFDIPLFAVNKFFGINGLIIYRGLLIGILGFSVYRLLRIHTAPNIAATLTVLALSAVRIRFFLRPSLASFILFALLFAALTILYEKEKINFRDWWPIPILFAVWANLHAGVIFGIILLASFLISSVVERKDSKGFLFVLAASAVFGLINPNFHQVYLYSFKYLAFKSAMAVTNIEHMPPAGILEDAQTLVFWLAAYIFGLLFLIRIRHAKPYLWILAAGLAYLAFTSLRGVPFFTITIIAAAASVWGSGKKLSFTLPFPAAALLMGVIALAAVFTQPQRIKFETAPRAFPVSAVDFVEKTGLTGKMFNSHPFGGYLIYRLYPGRKVFVDGRDLLHEKTIKLIAKHGYMRTLNAFGVEWIIAGYRDEVLKGLPNNEWSVVFSDDISVILARRGGENEGIIEEYGRPL